MSAFKFAIVKGWSMAPLLEEGDVVAYKNCEYSKGNIIIFNYNNLIVSHRLIYQDAKLTTKGDNMPFLDNEINKEDVIGVIQFIIKKREKVIFVNNKFINNCYLNYSLVELKVINIIRCVYKVKGLYSLNFTIKNIFFPWYVCNYLLQIVCGKQK